MASNASTRLRALTESLYTALSEVVGSDALIAYDEALNRVYGSITPHEEAAVLQLIQDIKEVLA